MLVFAHEDATGSPIHWSMPVRRKSLMRKLIKMVRMKGEREREKLTDLYTDHLFPGARLFIDAKAQLTLLGTEMDYVEDKLTSEFVFHNPNITGTCGCGESFSV